METLRPFWEYRRALGAGLVLNAYVFVGSAALAVTLGLVACLLRLHPVPLLRWCGTLYAELGRNTPEYVLLVWIHYVPPLILAWLLATKVSFSPFLSATLALGLASSGYFTETFRAGIQSIPRGHVEAAWSLGMSRGLAFRRIVLPQAARRMLPEAMNQLSLFKSTTLVSLIAVPDLMYQVSMITQEKMRPMPLYSGAAIVYFVVILAMSSGVRTLSERWRTRGLRSAAGRRLPDRGRVPVRTTSAHPAVRGVSRRNALGTQGVGHDTPGSSPPRGVPVRVSGV
jgi:polar amino acid transport system permease protein